MFEFRISAPADLEFASVASLATRTFSASGARQGLCARLSTRLISFLIYFIFSFFFYKNLSGVIGRSLMRCPVALKTALAIAAATPVVPISPSPLAPIGEICGSGLPTK